MRQRIRFDPAFDRFPTTHDADRLVFASDRGNAGPGETHSSVADRID
ncbi:MAG: hypothetical protein V3U03_15045 [Myxococcota bacterium]